MSHGLRPQRGISESHSVAEWSRSCWNTCKHLDSQNKVTKNKKKIVSYLRRRILNSRTWKCPKYSTTPKPGNRCNSSKWKNELPPYPHRGCRHDHVEPPGPMLRPVAVAVLGCSLFQVRYVWSPSFLGEGSQLIYPLLAVRIGLPWFDKVGSSEECTQ